MATVDSAAQGVCAVCFCVGQSVLEDNGGRARSRALFVLVLKGEAEGERSRMVVVHKSQDEIYLKR
jgi:hypothetical protein